MTVYRMLCLDIDGTLLNSAFKITSRTRDTIRYAAQKHNVMVVLVSARMPEGMYFLQDELGIEAPLVSYNGAMVFDEHRKVIAKEMIPVSSVRELHELLKGIPLHFNYYQGTKWYIEKENEWSRKESEITGTIPETVDYTALFDRWDEKKEGPNKILLLGEETAVYQAHCLLGEVNPAQILSFRSKPTYYEVIPSGASKTKAIRILQAKYQIETEQVIAVGDNFNDIDMLIHVGLGVAMGNAPDEVRQQAKAVTDTNDRDGVARVIEKYILQVK